MKGLPEGCAPIDPASITKDKVNHMIKVLQALHAKKSQSRCFRRVACYALTAHSPRLSPLITFAHFPEFQKIPSVNNIISSSMSPSRNSTNKENRRKGRVGKKCSKAPERDCEKANTQWALEHPDFFSWIPYVAVASSSYPAKALAISVASTCHSTEPRITL